MFGNICTVVFSTLKWGQEWWNIQVKSNPYCFSKENSRGAYIYHPFITKTHAKAFVNRVLKITQKRHGWVTRYFTDEHK